MSPEEYRAQIQEQLEGDLRNTRISIINKDTPTIAFIITSILITLGYMMVFTGVWGINIYESPNDVLIAIKTTISLWVVVRLQRMLLDRIRSYVAEPALVLGYSNDVFIEQEKGLIYVGRAKEIRVCKLTNKEELEYTSYWQDLGAIEVELQEGKTIRYICRDLTGYGGIKMTRRKKREQEDVYRLLDETDASAKDGQQIKLQNQGNK